MADKPLQSLNFPGRNYTYVNTPLSTAPTFDDTVVYSVGDYVTTYESLTQAAKVNNGNQSSIGAVCRNDNRTQAYGYRWSFEKVDKLPPLPPSKKCRPVVRISANGERKEYCSAAQAGRENGVSYRAILDTCMGKQNHSAGYRWEYAEIN